MSVFLRMNYPLRRKLSNAAEARELPRRCASAQLHQRDLPAAVA
jgi:hypothetical protein